MRCFPSLFLLYNQSIAKLGSNKIHTYGYYNEGIPPVWKLQEVVCKSLGQLFGARLLQPLPGWYSNNNFLWSEKQCRLIVRKMSIWSIYILQVLVRSPLFHPRMRSRNLEQAFSHSCQFQQRRSCTCQVTTMKLWSEWEWEVFIQDL